MVPRASERERERGEKSQIEAVCSAAGTGLKYTYLILRKTVFIPTSSALTTWFAEIIK